MSSVGQAAGGIVGGVIGFYVGGPSGAVYGAQLGMAVGGVIDPPDGPVINGPRLDDLSVQTATYGAFIARNYGTIAQTGNIFWLKGDALTETPRVEEQGGKGGPTSTTNLWDYSATFALGLCEGPIDGVRRIWINSQLFYDAGSDDITTIVKSAEASNLFTLYTGSDTQLADPLIQADKGIANVPAYRGLAYIVFEDLPLAKYNNSLAGAQIKVEIVKSGTVTPITQLPSVVVDNYPMAFSPRPVYQLSNSQVLGAQEGVISFYAYDITSDNDIVDGFRIPQVASIISISMDGELIGMTDDHPDTVRPQIVSNGNMASQIGILGTNPVWTTERGADNPIGSIYSIIPYGELIDQANPTVYGDICDIASFLPAAEIGRYVKALACASDGTSLLIVTTDGAIERYFIIDAELSIVNSGTVAAGFTGGYGNVSTLGLSCIYFSPTQDFGWMANSTGNGFDVQKYTIDDDNVLRTGSSIHDIRTVNNYFAITYYGGVFFVLCHNTAIGNTELFRFVDGESVTASSVQLSTIVQAECLTSKLLSASDLDVTELTDSVRGYRIASLGALRGGIDPLRAAWPFDVVQHGYQIKFKRRGSASVATITEDELDARAAGDNPGVRITNSREMDTLLPSSLHLKYLDVVREYDTNEQPSYKGDGSGHVVMVDIPVVLNADEASQAVAALHDLYWLERFDLSFVLPPTYSQLEPADVITVPASYATFELRLTSTNTLPDGRIECRAKYNNAALYVQPAAGEEGQSVGATLTLAGPCVYQLLDIPLMRDDDDTAGFPVALAGYLSGWPGGVLYRSDDSGETWADLKAFAPGQVIGYAATSLAAHGGTLLDKASTLSVRMYSGTLSSVTEAQMFAGQNWFAYGVDGRWEIIAVQNAVLQGDGSYVLTDFMRGQRGTEWASGLHVANDRIVKLNATTLEFVSVNTSTIGAPRTYRAITTGKGIDSDSSLSFTYAGVNLECLSPVNLTGNRHPSTNDWTLLWTRRSRFDGWRDYVDAALGESSESYEVDVYSDGTYTTIKRTLTSATQTVAYTSADQVTDFGSNRSTLYLKVYQLSSTVGRGYPLTTSITRT